MSALVTSSVEKKTNVITQSYLYFFVQARFNTLNAADCQH